MNYDNVHAFNVKVVTENSLSKQMVTYKTDHGIMASCFEKFNNIFIYSYFLNSGDLKIEKLKSLVRIQFRLFSWRCDRANPRIKFPAELLKLSIFSKCMKSGRGPPCQLWLPFLRREGTLLPRVYRNTIKLYWVFT